MHNPRADARARLKKTKLKHSRAALRTIQLAVDTVAHSIHQVKVLRRHLHKGHRRGLSALQMARHHSLNEPDIKRVEEIVGGYAQVADWPATMRSRRPHEGLERPLCDTESAVLALLAGQALTAAAGALTVCEQLDNWYGGLAVAAAVAARLAVPSVTVAAHRQRAAKLMTQLEQLCANNHINWAFVAAAGRSPAVQPSPQRTVH
jgi:hypothetical protein